MNSPAGFTVLRRDDQPVERWRNGGGTTRTVAVDPPGAGLATGFRWRLSIAAVAQDGPFSRLPGIDRTLWLLAGNGMELRCGGAANVLRERFERLDFTGEAEITARLLDGPTQDLNVMTKRGEAAAVSAIEHLAGGERRHLGGENGEQRVVLVLDGALFVQVAGDSPQSFGLAAGDALRLDRPGDLAIVADGSGCDFLGVGFRPVQR